MSDATVHRSQAPLSRPAAPAARDSLRTVRKTVRTGRSRARGRLLRPLVWLPPALLTLFGLCMMISLSPSVDASGGRYGLLRDQAVALAIGLAFLVFAWRADYRKVRVLSLAVFGAVFLSLLLVHVPGVALSKGGSRSWIGVGSITYQPSEFAKLAVILLGAHLLSSPRVSDKCFWSYMWPFGVLSLLACASVLLEGDLGTAVIIAGLVLGLLWMGGMRFVHWILVAGGGLGVVALATLLSEERMSRILSFLHPFADPYGSGFQLVQSLVALGRGGLLGVGAGQSVQKFQYLPQAHTDMVYAIVGEEFGLVGAASIIVLFAIFCIGCWRLARLCADPMGRLLISGCGLLVALQAIINVGGVIGALPLTGVPLPFVSYGGNSLVVMLAVVGLVLGVARRMAQTPGPPRVMEYENVTHLDRWRRHSGTRSARLGGR
jgi:cell division protein FtsW